VATVPSKSSVEATCLEYSSPGQVMDNPVLAADNHCGLRHHGPTGRFLTSPYAASLLSQNADTRLYRSIRRGPRTALIARGWTHDDIMLSACGRKQCSCGLGSSFRGTGAMGGRNVHWLSAASCNLFHRQNLLILRGFCRTVSLCR
jgi:hypothetical protein